MGSSARDITQPHNADSPPQALLPSPPTPQKQNLHPMTTKSKNNIHKPKLPSNSHVRYRIPKALLTTFQTLEQEPTCYSEAIENQNWRAVMNKEFNVLLKNGTWNLVPKPTNANLVGCMWAYWIKRKVNGDIERFKTRLVAK